MLIEKIKTNFWVESFLNSYSLMLFSLNKLLALIIILVSFFSPEVGFWGALAVISINFLSHHLGFNTEEIKQGLFGFNALFLGMGLGYYYQPSLSFGVLFFSSILTLLLITLFLKGLLEQYKLPYLSLPFIFTFWIVDIAAAGLDNITLNEGRVYELNQLAINQNNLWYNLTHSLDGLFLPLLIYNYLKTLAGIFFQDSLMAGLVLALALVLHSRISFLLSFIGFALAYLIYILLDADVNSLNQHLLGANYLFLSIAIGGFFYIPNRFSFVATVALIPVLLIVSMSLNRLLSVFYLQPYTLSFSLVCMTFLFAFNQRIFQRFLIPVYVQFFSPEKTVYKYLNNIKRFKYEHLYKLSLPFWGEWFVSQGYYGGITHLNEWGKALDFVIADSKNKTFKIPASGKANDLTTEHFYCFNKEVTAPMNGFVYDIINTVNDNSVGEVNTEQNWGNTIIINHLNGLFSQLSHLKKDSVGVFIGQYVYKGDYLAMCGNSGRSPEPHIHFQLQTTPVLGDKPIEYPIAYYIERKGEKRYLREWEIPTQDTFISNLQTNQLLTVAFGFYPGLKIKWILDGTNQTTDWEILTNAYNQTYIKCNTTKSVAYFINDNTMFFFTDFEGDNNSLLFKFYLGAFKILLGYYPDVDVIDSPPVYHFNYKPLQVLQDLIAPLFLFSKTQFKGCFSFTDNVYAPQKIKINTQVNYSVFNKMIKQNHFELVLSDYKIESFSFTVNEKNMRYNAVIFT